MRHVRSIAGMGQLAGIPGIFSLVVSLAGAAPALPAFPGAEGFGSETPGGRGGAIRFVDNTNDHGPGSLRAAIEELGPRIVIFRVSGDITLESSLFIDEPYLTIAGQTAPAGGIRIRNDPMGSFGGDSFPPIRIRTHDVVLRYLRLRPGMPDFDPQCTDIEPTSCFNDNMDPVNPNAQWVNVCCADTCTDPPPPPYQTFYECCRKSNPPCTDPSDIDGISIEQGSRDVVIDHASISWFSDEGIVLTRVQDVAIQSSFIAEGLDYVHYDPVPRTSYGKGILVGDKSAYQSGIVTGRLSIHHNLFAHDSARDPAIGSYCFDPLSPEVCFSDVVNNSAYNWSRFGLNANNFLGHTFLNIVNNYYKDGPDRLTGSGPNGQTMNDWTNAPSSPANGGQLRLHVEGNRTETTSGQITDPPILCSVWDVPTARFVPCNDTSVYLVPRFDTPAVTTLGAEDAYALALQDAGASARVDETGSWVPARDATDARIVAEVTAGNGSIIPDQATFLSRAYPPLTTGLPPADSDGDGLPDAWETRFGFDPDTPDDPNADTNRNGYLDIEEYLNGTDPRAASGVPGLLGPGIGVALALLVGVGIAWRETRS